MTVATLTGHALKAIGEPYSIILNNGPARRLKIAEQVQEAGNDIGDLFEISTIRREDYNAHKGKGPSVKVIRRNIPHLFPFRQIRIRGCFAVQQRPFDSNSSWTSKSSCVHDHGIWTNQSKEN